MYKRKGVYQTLESEVRSGRGQILEWEGLSPGVGGAKSWSGRGQVLEWEGPSPGVGGPNPGVGGAKSWSGRGQVLEWEGPNPGVGGAKSWSGRGQIHFLNSEVTQCTTVLHWDTEWCPYYKDFSYPEVCNRQVLCTYTYSYTVCTYVQCHVFLYT